MSQEKPVVRKTKKSSYKPMSKLNEDSLIDLRRTEKPEYSTRVFYFNTSSRARLNTSVNVWFRDHQNVMTNIGRQQRAVYKIQCRVKNEQRRVQRQLHKRKQEDLRRDLRRRHIEYTQRRVVRQFRKNAARKMAARGEKSIAAMRLEATFGAGFDPSLLVSATLSADEGLDMIEPLMKVASGLSVKSDDGVAEPGPESGKDGESRGNPPSTQTANQKVHASSSQDDSGKSAFIEAKGQDDLAMKERTTDTGSDVSHATSSSVSTASNSVTTLRPASEPDPQFPKHSTRKRSSMVSVAPREDLGAIPEVASPCPSIDKEILPERECTPSLPMNKGRVLEVQYYRSVRGTLQPLLTEPNRRVFTPPSNRARYQQVKLLRQEHQKDLSRRENIDKFFSELFSHQQTGLLASMVQRMRQADTLGRQAANRNSLDSLSKCQYLRVHDWDSKDGDKGEGDSTGSQGCDVDAADVMYHH
nr:hypothetical protein BaRGS_019518 [Batillaria attramentaria]